MAATIRTRSTKDGVVRYQVRWRTSDVRQTSVTTMSSTYAKRVAGLVTAFGYLPDKVVDAPAAPTFADALRVHTLGLSGTTPGTVADYRSQESCRPGSPLIGDYWLQRCCVLR